MEKIETKKNNTEDKQEYDDSGRQKRIHEKLYESISTTKGCMFVWYKCDEIMAL
jgi:hypothetical protein